MGKWDGYHDIDQDEDEDMEYYADVHGYEDDEPEPVELTDAEVIARLKDELDAANARIAELETRIEVLEAENKQVNADKISWRVGAHAQRTLTKRANDRIAELEAQVKAVPAEEMYFYMRHSCGWRIGTPEKAEQYTRCERRIEGWLVEQPECDTWIKRMQP